MYSGRAVPSTTSLEITTSSTPSRLGRSNMVSSRMPSMMERRPRAPVFRSMALRAIAPSASSAQVRSIDSISNSRWHCLNSAVLRPTNRHRPLALRAHRVLRLDQDLLERGFVQILERGDHRQAADEFGNEAVFE